MGKDLQWLAIIKGEAYRVDFSANTFKLSEEQLGISRIYGLKRKGNNYVLAMLTNGTYRLYSKGQKRLHTAGKSKTIEFKPIVTLVNKTTH